MLSKSRTSLLARTQRRTAATVLLKLFAVKLQRLARVLPAPWLHLVRERQPVKQIRRGVRNRVAKTRAVDPITSADIAGLRYVNDGTIPGIRRVGRGQRYVDANGHAISRREVSQQITSLAILPAWRARLDLSRSSRSFVGDRLGKQACLARRGRLVRPAARDESGMTTSRVTFENPSVLPVFPGLQEKMNR